MSTELKITKEKVLEAAGKCSTAKETLKTLFPEVFEGSGSIDIRSLSVSGTSNILNPKSSLYRMIEIYQVEGQPKFTHHSFWLNPAYDWKLINNSGALLLVPTIK